MVGHQLAIPAEERTKDGLRNATTCPAPLLRERRKRRAARARWYYSGAMPPLPAAAARAGSIPTLFISIGALPAPSLTYEDLPRALAACRKLLCSAYRVGTRCAAGAI